MHRRAFIFGVAFGLSTGSVAAGAQPAGKVYRVGLICPWAATQARRAGSVISEGPGTILGLNPRPALRGVYVLAGAFRCSGMTCAP